MIGYHCTQMKNVRKIKKEGFQIQRSQALPGDLGSGIYFFVNMDSFQNAKEMAIKFGKQYRAGRDGGIPLGLISVEIDSNRIMDMRNLKSKELFYKFRKDNMKVIENRFQLLKDRVKHYSRNISRGNLDGYCFDLIYDNNSQIDGFIKDTYTPVDMKGYKRSSFPNGVECCVYNMQVIQIMSITSIEMERL